MLVDEKEIEVLVTKIDGRKKDKITKEDFKKLAEFEKSEKKEKEKGKSASPKKKSRKDEEEEEESER